MQASNIGEEDAVPVFSMGKNATMRYIFEDAVEGGGSRPFEHKLVGSASTIRVRARG